LLEQIFESVCWASFIGDGKGGDRKADPYLFIREKGKDEYLKFAERCAHMWTI